MSADPVRQARSAVALATRYNRDPRPARRTLWVAKLGRLIDEALASPDAPTFEQRAELAALLTGGDAR